jgi:hypothetical protein
LGFPTAIAIDRGGNVFIADNSPPGASASPPPSCQVREVSAATGIITAVTGSGLPGKNLDSDGRPITFCVGIALNSRGDVYVSGDGLVRRFVPATGEFRAFAGTGKPGPLGDGGPARSASLSYPAGLAVDTNDNLYVADSQDHRIRRVDGEGIITTVAGDGTPGFSGDGGLAIRAQLQSPQGVALDQRGTIYIADTDNYVVRAVSPTDGIIRTVAGARPGESIRSTSRPWWLCSAMRGVIPVDAHGAAGQALLCRVFAVKVGASGDLWVADHRLLQIAAPSQTIATITRSPDSITPEQRQGQIKEVPVVDALMDAQDLVPLPNGDVLILDGGLRLVRLLTKR